MNLKPQDAGKMLLRQGGQGFIGVLPMKPTVTIAIPTYNRAVYWRAGFLLDSLRRQTDHDFEVLIVDDNSGDGTSNVLQEVLKEPFPFPIRAFHCHAPKKKQKLASALPDNILIQNADPDSIFIHLDDDGWVSENVVAEVKKMNLLNHPAAVWGRIVVVDPTTLSPQGSDSRVRFLPDELPKDGLFKLTPFHDGDWGAFWVVPTSILRKMGGHDMNGVVENRGCDLTLGLRFQKLLTTYYGFNLVFYHLGWTYLQTMINQGKEEEARKTLYIPEKIPVVVNGGESFWKQDDLRRLYTEITI